MKILQSLLRLPLLRRIQLPPVVGVLRLGGVIGAAGPLRQGMTLAGLADPIERAFNLPNLSAVALVINSPGGSPVQSELIARRIRDLAAEKNVKVYAFCEDAAASGGYWLACAADEIYASENSIVGSIGVVSAGFGFPELIRRYGIERRVYASGDKKVILDPFRDEDPEEVETLKAKQAKIHDNFKALVRERRRDKLAGDEATLFSGEFWTGQEAYELGLVDGFGEVRHTLRGIYGDKVKLKLVEAQKSWLRRRLPLGAAAPALPDGWAGDVLAALEERAMWGRLGL